MWGQPTAPTPDEGGAVEPTVSPSQDPASPDDDDKDAADVAAQLMNVQKASRDSTLPAEGSNNSGSKPIQPDQDIDGEAMVAEENDDLAATRTPTVWTVAAESPAGSDNESAPEEIGIIRQAEVPNQAEEQIHDEPLVKQDRTRPDCTAWMTGGSCKFGKQCRYAHDPQKRGKPKREPPQPAKNPFERGDLIGKLVHNEIRHEVSDLTQVIDFLARNDWLKNVELYPGHKAEIEGRINEVA